MSDLINIVNLQHSTHVPVIVISIEEHNKLLEKIALLEKEKSQLEIKKNRIQEQFENLSLSIEKYIQEINILKEEKELLEKTIVELNERLQCLENDKIQNNKRINDLELQVSQLIKEKNKNDIMLKRSQCITLYKDKIKNKIFVDLDKDDDKEIQKWDLFSILHGDYNERMTPKELERKDNIISSINAKYKKYEYHNKRLNKDMKGIDFFHNYIKNISKERNTFAHPDISKEELIELKQDFINNATTKNEKINEQLFINDIFEVLLD